MLCSGVPSDPDCESKAPVKEVVSPSLPNSMQANLSERNVVAYHLSFSLRALVGLQLHTIRIKPSCCATYLCSLASLWILRFCFCKTQGTGIANSGWTFEGGEVPAGVARVAMGCRFL